MLSHISFQFLNEGFIIILVVDFWLPLYLLLKLHLDFGEVEGDLLHILNKQDWFRDADLIHDLIDGDELL